MFSSAEPCTQKVGTINSTCSLFDATISSTAIKAGHPHYRIQRAACCVASSNLFPVPLSRFLPIPGLVLPANFFFLFFFATFVKPLQRQAGHRKNTTASLRLVS